MCVPGGSERWGEAICACQERASARGEEVLCVPGESCWSMFRSPASSFIVWSSLEGSVIFLLAVMIKVRNESDQSMDAFSFQSSSTHNLSILHTAIYQAAPEAAENLSCGCCY